MVSLNRLMLIGDLGTDPELRYTPNGNAVTTFRLAVSRKYKGQQRGTAGRDRVVYRRDVEQASRELQPVPI